MQRRSAVVVFVLFLAATAVPALAQIQMPESVVSSGGQDMANGSYRVRGTLGQTAIGIAANPSYDLEIGFWHGYREYVSAAPEPPALIWSLEQNHPNPFNPRTTIDYSLPADARVTLRIYNLRGELVRTLVERTVAAGHHTETWNGRDDAGASVASGVYVARLDSEHGVLTRKMVLAR